MKTRFKKLFLQNFFAAFAVLFLFKTASVLNNVFGTEGFASGANLFGKMFLVIGTDVLGATCLAALICFLSIVFLRKRDPSLVVNSISITIQTAHSLLVAVSFFATIYIGGPLNREVLELAALGGGGPKAADSSPAMWSSISHYLGFVQISTMVLSIVVAVLVYLYVPRLIARLGKTIRLSIGGFLFAQMLITLFLLPWLINGHLFGIRVHTFGLEKSAGVEMGYSYLSPLFARIGRGDINIEDEFKLNFNSIAPLEAKHPNPLRNAIPQKTNLIMITLESVADIYALDPAGHMPFLRNLSQFDGSVLFTNHYSVWPQTMKALFSLSCAELPYPYYKSITATNPSIPCISISEALHANGYYTALITSADLAYDRKRRFFNHRDFDMFMDMRNMPGRETVWGDSWGLDDRLAVKNILSLADQKRDEGFFIFYEMFTAHHPYIACREHVEHPIKDEFKAYERALGYIDDRIKDIVNGLKSRGLLENTLIAIVADHGEGFGQHPGSRGHGAKVYQENIQVPFAIMGPQLKGITGTVSMPTSHIDVAPTLLGLLGINIPCTMKGRDFTTTSKPRLVFFGGRPPGGQMGLVDGIWKYILEDSGEEFLYNLPNDPHEKKNIVSDNETLCKKYKKKLDEWRVFSQNLIENYSTIRADSECFGKYVVNAKQN